MGGYRPPVSTRLQRTYTFASLALRAKLSFTEASCLLGDNPQCR